MGVVAVDIGWGLIRLGSVLFDLRRWWWCCEEGVWCFLTLLLVEPLPLLGDWLGERERMLMARRRAGRFIAALRRGWRG